MSSPNRIKLTESGASTDRAARREGLERRSRRVRRAQRYDWRVELRDAAGLLSARRAPA